jgi:antitoxin component YwqK of YwqJK toxin-antitoxin module
MTKLLLILMVVSLWSGCGGDSPTGDGKGKLLVWTTNYDDGSVKEEYQYYHHPDNNQRVKDGWYKSYYSNGGYEEVTTYTDGKLDGELV